MRAIARSLGACVAIAVAAGAAAPALAIDEAHHKQAREMIGRAIGYLRAQQDKESGGWAINAEGPDYPAIASLVVTGMLLDPEIDAEDESVSKGVSYILSFKQPDGGIYDQVLPSYNTSIALSALALVNRPEAAAAIKPAQDFLRGIQWSEESLDREGETADVTSSHPFYGGVGYGRHGRPDGSNVGFFVQGLHDSGLDCNDPAIQRAMVFLTRTQMLDEVNDQPYADGSRQGGFVYATSENKDKVGSGQSHTGMIDETLADGTVAPRLRCYGSMTYSGLKSMCYANLSRDDVRVRAAYDWIQRHYTLEENPGAGTDGLYYYYVTFARALNAWGPPTIVTRGAEGGEGASRDWQNDLVDKLATLQNDDGSFKSVDDRWMENNQVLITAFALIALQNCTP